MLSFADPIYHTLLRGLKSQKCESEEVIGDQPKEKDRTLLQLFLIETTMLHVAKNVLQMIDHISVSEGFLKQN